MANNDFMSIVFSNVNDDMMMELTKKRSMGSLPFGGRYRAIDFALSNLVNAGVRKVGIITKLNYHSLMDHLGAGRAWDLDRKQGGLVILPPYSIGYGVYAGNIDALMGVITFLRNSIHKYVVLCDSDVIANFDVEKMIDAHIANEADVTVAYKHGKLPKNNRDLMVFNIGKNEKINDIQFFEMAGKTCDFSLDVMVFEREKLIELVENASTHNDTSLSINVFQKNLGKLKMQGFRVDEYVAVMDGVDSYFKANMDLLDKTVRQSLFNPARPIYTKTRDDMPVKYGLSSVSKNSTIADGSIIEGTVENCIIFRGVHVAKNAVVKNCILMQDTVVGEGAQLDYIVTDKNVVISKGRILTGSENYPMVIGKGVTV